MAITYCRSQSQQTQTSWANQRSLPKPHISGVLPRSRTARKPCPSIFWMRRHLCALRHLPGVRITPSLPAPLPRGCLSSQCRYLLNSSIVESLSGGTRVRRRRCEKQKKACLQVPIISVIGLLVTLKLEGEQKAYSMLISKLTRWEPQNQGPNNILKGKSACVLLFLFSAWIFQPLIYPRSWLSRSYKMGCHWNLPSRATQQK